jgi:hypothetical protein
LASTGRLFTQTFLPEGMESNTAYYLCNTFTFRAVSPIHPNRLWKSTFSQALWEENNKFKDTRGKKVKSLYREK